ncbi:MULTISPECIES: pentapeptide repeat-containing protein [Brevibacillus]|uniref:Pentapeptide repeat-containing protein n=1 Tax=Brevibacillus borstelensis AK1 TaxID=1300222 RepID=M8E7B8_9BACL|nr:pentapeptide repeat-containing protein [Brevibacillus borstelensis]EMT51365.1 pentapeptide repeat-containing protein [Brevibacillus borstelensis AK1]KKX54898.1 oxetanocin A resistance protein [Brevibacillus borstelensis cifa_chp40]MCC0565774.1 pentapeptide repeat-containing protein [Brevibacillus borstelensis]MCM3473185.1 pentapeptide repeat-containing protein [Brevibacillus borstelensis]MCM3560378.1 pentapeptide repeat-containing protein [Brevibacillus borstelensis]
MSEDLEYAKAPHGSSRLSLQADCENCFGLCCVALPFAASADFAIDKHAGQPCQNLQADFRCGVHNSLRQMGFRGCTVYDCFGAGQKVSQVTYGGLDWRKSPKSAKEMFEVFPIMWQLHELLWYLSEALTLRPARPIRDELSQALDKTERLTNLDPDSILKLDVAAHRADVNKLLLRTSELVRADFLRSQRGSAGKRKTYSRGADLIGAKLRGADLRAANLRGAYLIAADLRGADLRGADLIGADFRDADIRGADLTESIFLTQPQINAAKGDASTKLPPSLSHPMHWSSPEA